ncbi:MAG: hypothetical protein MJY43_00140 [Bacteroidales bacterium]|nr:hypothetical protein [Bacteroidales bacterium]
MKNAVITLLAVAAMCLSVAGCQKSGKDVFRGNYTFKTSGYLAAVCDSVRECGGVAVADTLIAELDTQSGQMDISDMGGGKLLVSMNRIPGKVSVMYAEVDGSALSIIPAKERTEFTLAGGLIPDSADLTVGGTGRKYEGILLFDLVYEGEIRCLGHEYKITESKVICRAKENE